MAYKKFYGQWTGVWRANGSYYGGGNILVGGGDGFDSLIGFNSVAIKEAIDSSKVEPVIRLHFYVRNPGTFDFGMHKSTSNRAADGIPFYVWTGRSVNPSTGWASYDITKFNRSISGSDNTFAGALNNGYHGPVLYGGTGGAYGEADGSGGSNQIYIAIEGTWNESPSKPNVTYPTGSETLNGNITMRATGASDPEGDSLTYQFALYDGSWNYFQRQSSLSRAVNLDDYNETSVAKIACRAYDGQSYGGWDYSSVFTIKRNTKPLTPTPLEPVGGVKVDRSKSKFFNWRNNDDSEQSLWYIRWRLKGADEWNYLSEETTETRTYILGSTFPAGEIEWQVRMFDQAGLRSEYSPSAIFYATDQTDAPEILEPTNTDIISDPVATIRWSSVNQNEYQVEVLEGSDVYWSVARVSGNKGVTIGEPLENDASYTIRVRVRSKGGFWSEWASISVATSFTPPAQPELEIEEKRGQAAIYVYIDNPAPTTDQPAVIGNDLYRRRKGEAWIRVAEGVPPNTGFMDYTPAGNTVYEYYAETKGANAAVIQSVPVIGSVEINDIILSIATIATESIHLSKILSKGFKMDFNANTMNFSGRTYPVTEFGETIEEESATEYRLTHQEYEYLIRILKQRETLLFRDKRGRKKFVTAPSVSVVDEHINHYKITLPLNDVDYKEEV
ncbi:hypothetical protein [Halobacillus sp. Cin3]|uniref:hypothetical protein n=1 Tax=Halobacillus sp. Cin3 TaxID=2928441 RepID=UPI00248D77FE|nr:hypothetical protein [Halobacillus sp. Cin3]